MNIEIKAKPNKDSSGKGQMAAWKVYIVSANLSIRFPNWSPTDCITSTGEPDRQGIRSTRRRLREWARL
jgi:hypothetical protein